ncbi:hypothetical protein L1049_003290 [Liquidambar formosana]|uniref:Mitochondrial import inner membrane translocase subunit TIM50 n=1 Tax=Liquidambar formosana TaxID=63359 RepID=A0AAP0R9J6_LIQFO
MTVPFDAYSAMLADKRVVLMMRVQERKAMQDNHDTKTPDSTFDCHPVAKQITENNKKLDDELEEQAEDSLVLSEKIIEVSLAESKSKEKFLSSDVDVAKQVAISIVNGKNNQSHSSPKRPLVGRLRKKLLILDVNGLLADIVSPPPKDYKADIKIARRAIFKRPFCSDFLKFCFERFDVGIWSSRTKKNVERVIDYLMGDMKHKLLFCWDLSHCTETGFYTLREQA